MSIYYINSGETSTGIILKNDDIMYVSSGGTADSTTVNYGGELYVYSGGTATNIVWSPFEGKIMLWDGATYSYANELTGVYYGSPGKLLSHGMKMDSVTLKDAQELYVMYGGTATDTKISAGCVAYVSSGGRANNTNVYSGGAVLIDKKGSASGVSANSGCWVVVVSGGTALDILENGGYVQLEKGAFVTFKPNTISGLTLEEATCISIHSGTTAISTTLTSGNIVEIFSGGVASNMFMNDSCNVNVYSAGSICSATVQNGGLLSVEGAWATSATAEMSGSIGVSQEGVAWFTTLKYGGHMTVAEEGLVIETGVEGGVLNISSGGTARSAFVSSGGRLNIFSDGLADMTTVRSSGYTYIYDGGLASGTEVYSGGRLYVSSGGTANSTYLAGKSVSDSQGGAMFVLAGAEANSTTVNNGGRMIVSSGGKNNEITVYSGGMVGVRSGGVLTGMMDFRSGANVTISSGGIIDFDLTNASAGAEALVNDLSLISGSPKYTLTVELNQAFGDYVLAVGAAGFDKTITVKDTSGITLGSLKIGQSVLIYDASYTLSQDRAGLAVKVEKSDIFTGILNTSKSISSAMSAVDVDIIESGLLYISYMGVASRTRVSSGGLLIVPLGVASETTVNSGGILNVSRQGMVHQTTINNQGILNVVEDGTAKQTTVNYGGLVNVSAGGVTSDTTVSSGSLLVSSGGRADWTIVSRGGHMEVFSGGMADANTVADGGTLILHADGSANRTIVRGGIIDSQGGHMSLSNATAISTTISSGGSLDAYYSVLDGVTVLSGGRLFFLGESVLTGVVTLSSGASITMQSDTCLNFDLAQTTVDAITPLVNDLSIIKHTPGYTLTLRGNEWLGTYKLAGCAAGFDKTITVKNTFNETLGSLAVGQTTTIGGVDYTLNLGGDNVLSVTVGAVAPTTVAKSDIDGNGVSDVMFVWTGEHGEGNYQHGYWMNGTSTWQSAGSNHPAEWENLGCYDMTGDGKADSVLVGNVEVNGVKGAYIGYYADANDLPDGSTWVNIGYLNNADDIVWKNKVGNLTGSTANSIVWYAPELYSLGAWKDGKEDWVSMSSTFGGDAWTLVGCGDFNGDGKDSVVMSYNGGQLFYAVGIDGVPQSLGSSNWSGWEVRAIGDFKGDGKDDLVLFHKDSGSMVLCADGNIDSYVSIGQLDAGDWFVVGAGDYDGDKQDDLLVRQYSTGMLGYYSACDTSKWNVLGYGVDMTWTVIA